MLYSKRQKLPFLVLYLFPVSLPRITNIKDHQDVWRMEDLYRVFPKRILSSEKKRVLHLGDKVDIDLDLNRMQGTLAPKRKEATWSSGENYDVQCIINSSTYVSQQ